MLGPTASPSIDKVPIKNTLTRESRQDKHRSSSSRPLLETTALPDTPLSTMASDTMPSANTISDDWHDLGDDNLSVISLPASEPGSPRESPRAKPSVPTAEPGAANPPESGQDTAREVVQENTKEEDAAILTAELRDSPSPQFWHEAQSEPLEDPFKDPSPPLNESEIEGEDVTNGIQEILDGGSRNLDPVYLRKTIESVEGILRDTKNTVKSSAMAQPLLTDLANHMCSELLAQIHELRIIISVYARAPPQNDYQIPIDSGLHEWLSNVRVRALGVQAELQEAQREPERAKERYDEEQLWTRSDVFENKPPELVKICEALTECKTQMDDFLPIIKADFDEFQTKNLLLATAGVGASTRSLRSRSRSPLSRSAPIDIPQAGTTPPRDSKTSPLNNNTPRNQIWHLRRELYALKDTLQQATTKLNFGSAATNPTAMTEWSGALAERYTALVSAIGVALTNHGSDWLESAISGASGMSFVDFRQLDRETLALYRAQLLEAVGEDDDPDSLCRAFTYRDGKARVRAARTETPVRPTADELAMLQGIADTLELMFKLRTE